MAARLPELEAALVALRAIAKPTTDEQRTLARQQHARWPELKRLQAALSEEDDRAAREALTEQIATLQNEIEVAGFEFADGRDAYLHRTLTRLVTEQGVFVRSDVLPGVQKRLAAARTVKQQTIDGFQAKWDAAIAAIKASDGVTASKLRALRDEAAAWLGADRHGRRIAALGVHPHGVRHARQGDSGA